jgi:hypothetical protein
MYDVLRRWENFKAVGKNRLSSRRIVKHKLCGKEVKRKRFKRQIVHEGLESHTQGFNYYPTLAGSTDKS